MARDLERRGVSTAIWWAIQLSRDLETCRALLRGDLVDEASLDPKWLARATQRRFVSLDVLAIDLFSAQLEQAAP